MRGWERDLHEQNSDHKCLKFAILSAKWLAQQMSIFSAPLTKGALKLGMSFGKYLISFSLARLQLTRRSSRCFRSGSAIQLCNFSIPMGSKNWPLYRFRVATETLLHSRSGVQFTLLFCHALLYTIYSTTVSTDRGSIDP